MGANKEAFLSAGFPLCLKKGEKLCAWRKGKAALAPSSCQSWSQGWFTPDAYLAPSFLNGWVLDGFMLCLGAA